MKLLLKNQSGATAVEYGIIVALISVVVILSMQTVGQEQNRTMGKIGAALAGFNLEAVFNSFKSPDGTGGYGFGSNGQGAKTGTSIKNAIESSFYGDTETMAKYKDNPAALRSTMASLRQVGWNAAAAHASSTGTSIHGDGAAKQAAAAVKNAMSNL